MECEPRDCEVETALDRLLNDTVFPATEITVTTWIYFGKMSIEPRQNSSRSFFSYFDQLIGIKRPRNNLLFSRRPENIDPVYLVRLV